MTPTLRKQERKMLTNWKKADPARDPLKILQDYLDWRLAAGLTTPIPVFDPPVTRDSRIIAKRLSHQNQPGAYPGLHPVNPDYGFTFGESDE